MSPYLQAFAFSKRLDKDKTDIPSYKRAKYYSPHKLLKSGETGCRTQSNITLRRQRHERRQDKAEAIFWRGLVHLVHDESRK